MANSGGSESLVGVWEHIRSENMDAFLKEMGVGMAIRLLAKSMNPRVTISEKDGKWTLRTEMPMKNSSITFTSSVPFDDKTPDGHEIKKMIRCENGQWTEHLTREDGKESVLKRRVNDQGLQEIEMTSGSVKARQWFTRKT